MGSLESVDPDESLWDWLAHDLRFYRLKHHLDGPEMGRLIGVSKQAVNNYERADRRIDDDQARVLDKEWKTGGHFLRLLTYARLGHDPDWFKQHVEYEARAEVLRIYEVALVPGILQTEPYARTLFTVAKSRDLDAQVNARLARQELLHRPDPPEVWILLDEYVIDRPVGGPEVMREQLAHLIDISHLPHVRLRVVPRSVGAHVGLEGSFKVITADGADVAYTEANGGGRLARDAAEVRSFAGRHDEIGADALSRDASRRFISQSMETIA